jgi:hypothetical protein
MTVVVKPFLSDELLSLVGAAIGESGGSRNVMHLLRPLAS